MRFLLQQPLGNHLSGASALGFLSSARGKTLGRMGEINLGECPPTLLSTSVGTLLVAAGVGPMMRMRQNENVLSTAGVPAPLNAPVISVPDDATGDSGSDTTDDDGNDITFADTLVQEFDFSDYSPYIITFTAAGGPGSVQPDESGLGFSYVGTVVSGQDSIDARLAAWEQYKGRIVQLLPASSTVYDYRNWYNVNDNKHYYSDEAAGQTNAIDFRKPDIYNPLAVQPTVITTPTTGVPNPKYYFLYAFFIGASGQWFGNGGFYTRYNWKATKFTFDVLTNTPTEITQDGPSNTDPDANPNRLGSITGRYQAFQRFVDKDGYVSNPSPISGDIVVTQAHYLVYSEVETPNDSRIVKRQIFRNTNGQADVFYLDIETTDLTSTTFRTYNTDAQLKLKLELPLFDNDGFSLAYLYGLPPADKPYIEEFNSRVVAVGTVDYQTGHAEVTNGSETVQGIGTAWNTSMIGWKFVCVDTYIVVGVDKTAQTLTLDRAYQGGTDTLASYSLRPFAGEANLIRWSLAGYPESWPIENAFGLPQDDDEVTGLVKFNNSLFILKTRHIYQFNMGLDPLRDSQVRPIAQRGCVNHRCAVPVAGVCLMLDRQGVHAFSGGPSPETISLPVADLFRREGEWLRVNWDSELCLWHAVHMEEQCLVRWYVAMTGSRYPYHAICYDYRKNRWWVEEYPIAITSSVNSTEILGRPLLGAEDGLLLTSDVGPLDLVPETGTTRLTVSAQLDDYAVELDGTPADAEGTTIAVVEGTGRGQWRVIADIDGSEVIADQPWSITLDDTSVVQIGAVPYYLQTGEFSKAKLEMDSPQAIQVEYTQSSYPLSLYLGVLQDGATTETENVLTIAWGSLYATTDDPRVKRIDLADRSGVAISNLDRQRERDMPVSYSISVILQGFSGESKPQIAEISVVGASG